MLSICLWHRLGGMRRRKLKACHLGFKRMSVSTSGRDCLVTVHLIGGAGEHCLHASEYQLDLDRTSALALQALLSEALSSEDYCHRSVTAA
jgi:hypothetical protein